MNVRLSKKHQRTLAAIFSTQAPATLPWRRIEALFIALGAIKEEGRGSSVTFKLKEEHTTFHRPHPQKEAKRYHVRDARDFMHEISLKE